jgi:ADP-ribosylation factor GTPase-activating protein 2/3
LSSKKTQKLGAKKVVSGDAIDFEEAERKAREEAERIEKLGYNPEAEQAEAEAKEKAVASPAARIASPTPLSPPRGGFGATSKTHERSPSEMERLGMGIGRLGFGQVSKPAVKKPGFGAVGPAKAPIDGMLFP